MLYQSSSEAIKKALVGAVTFGQKSLQKGGVQFIRLLPPLSSAGDELTRECAYQPGSARPKDVRSLVAFSPTSVTVIDGA
jgi:hypothetical protein